MRRVLSYCVFGAVVVLLLSSFCHKMIAAETLFVFQSIFLLHFCAVHYTSNISLFKMFTLSMGNFLFLINEGNNIYTYPSLGMPFDVLNCILSYSFIVSITLLFASFFGVAKVRSLKN